MWASCNRNYDGSEGGRRREPQQRARTAVYGVTEPSEYVCGEMLKSSQLNAHHFDFDFDRRRYPSSPRTLVTYTRSRRARWVGEESEPLESSLPVRELVVRASRRGDLRFGMASDEAPSLVGEHGAWWVSFQPVRFSLLEQLARAPAHRHFDRPSTVVDVRIESCMIYTPLSSWKLIPGIVT